MHGDVAPFDRFARFYDLFAPGADADELANGLARAERPIDRMLDVGGGPGRALDAIDPEMGVVVDAAPGMAERARGNGREAILGDGGRLPVATASVDAVAVTDALHHIGDQAGLLAEAARVLRPGGVLVVLDFDPTTVRGRLLAGAEHAIGMDSVFRPPAELAAMMADAGLAPTVLRDGFGYTVAGVAPPAESGGSKSSPAQ